MVRPSPHALTARLRQDLAAIVRAAIDAADAGRLVSGALDTPDLVSRLHCAGTVHVIAAGKAAAPMLNAFAAGVAVPLGRVLGIGPDAAPLLPAVAEWRQGSHPIPDERSVFAARGALEIAAASAAEDLLVVLLSGGASALMAAPVDGLTLADKQAATRTLLANGADIHGLNVVRKHISSIKGGRLAAASAARVLTLAISDVIGDDPAVIGSGPTTPDPTTYGEALQVLASHGGFDAYPASVLAVLERGAAGNGVETPKPDDMRLRRTEVRVIGNNTTARQAAEGEAAARGYFVHRVPVPVVGEARDAASRFAREAEAALRAAHPPLCVVAGGETTVTVKGGGLGGRNQEFALALAGSLRGLGGPVVAASVGTDGVDGPTDAAGAIVDSTTIARARAAGLNPASALDGNDSYTFFSALGDLVKTGPTCTNVADLMVLLVGE